MIAIWYAILSFMLLMFVVLEGFDIGAGMLQYVVGKTEAERRIVITAIGPLWSWHEVWLVGFGGTLLMAFPTFMAATFSGFYLALFLLIWCMVLRGVSIEVSGHIADPLWRTGQTALRREPRASCTTEALRSLKSSGRSFSCCSRLSRGRRGKSAPS